MKQNNATQDNRRNNLEVLKKISGGTLKTLVELTGLRRTMLSGFLNHMPMSDNWAREIEKNAKKPDFWLDKEPEADAGCDKQSLYYALRFIDDIAKSEYESMILDAKADFLHKLIIVFNSESVRNLTSTDIKNIMGLNANATYTERKKKTNGN